MANNQKAKGMIAVTVASLERVLKDAKKRGLKGDALVSVTPGGKMILQDGKDQSPLTDKGGGKKNKKPKNGDKKEDDDGISSKVPEHNSRKTGLADIVFPTSIVRK